MAASPGFEVTAESAASKRGVTPDTMLRRDARLVERDMVAVMATCLGNGLRLHRA